jgi:hypothetical protein
MKTYLLLLRVVLFASFILTLLVTTVFYVQNWKMDPLLPTVSVILFVLMLADGFNSRLISRDNG